MIVQQLTLGGRNFSLRSNLHRRRWSSGDLPLVVALHGGTYTSRYFDIEGYSLLARADALGIPVIALDRPGYGETALIGAEDATHATNAEILDGALADLWRQYGQDRAGIVLIGHSIGGAVALRIAARLPSWPLLGVAVSGLGMRIPASTDAAAAFPPTPFIDVPPVVKDSQMFGAPSTFAATAPDDSRVADAPAPVQELIDIVSRWPREAGPILAAVETPIHYRQADHDNLWVVSPEEIDAFATSCSRSPRVDSGTVKSSGHCIDLHKIGPSFQLEQIAFALRCAVDSRLARSVGRDQVN